MQDALTALDAVAGDRIRDIKAAKAALAALVKACRALTDPILEATAAAPPGDWAPRVIGRLCYFANARDSSVRTSAFRAVRYCVATREHALFLYGTRLVLSIVRSLEREAKLALLWERLQAMKLVRLLLDLAPDQLPFCILRSLVALVTYSASESSSSSSSSGGGDGGGEEGGKGGKAAAAATTAGGSSSSGSAPDSGSPTDPLRRIALETLRRCVLEGSCRLRALAAGAEAALSKALVEAATTPADHDLLMPLLATFMALSASSEGNGSRSSDLPLARNVLRPALAAFSSAFLAGHASSGEGVDAETRQRWAAARHMLVTVSRFRVGALALQSDPEVLVGLVSLVSHAAVQGMSEQRRPAKAAAAAAAGGPSSSGPKLPPVWAELSLCVLATLIELVCPPVSAAVEGLPELMGSAPRPRGQASEAAAPASSLAGAHAALARQVAGPLASAYGAADAATAQALALAHGANRAAAAAASVGASPAAPPPLVLPPPGRAVPYYAALNQQSWRSDAGPASAAFWGALDRAGGELLSRSSASSSRAAREALPEAAIRTAQARLGVAAGTSDVRASSTALPEPARVPFVTAVDVADAHRAALLQQLLEADVLQAVTLLSMTPLPLAAAAGRAALRYFVGLARALLPPDPRHWHLPDLTALAAAASGVRRVLPPPTVLAPSRPPPLAFAAVLAAYNVTVSLTLEVGAPRTSGPRVVHVADVSVRPGAASQPALRYLHGGSTSSTSPRDAWLAATVLAVAGAAADQGLVSASLSVEDGTGRASERALVPARQPRQRATHSSVRAGISRRVTRSAPPRALHCLAHNVWAGSSLFTASEALVAAGPAGPFGTAFADPLAALLPSPDAGVAPLPQTQGPLSPTGSAAAAARATPGRVPSSAPSAGEGGADVTAPLNLSRSQRLAVITGAVMHPANQAQAPPALSIRSPSASVTLSGGNGEGQRAPQPAPASSASSSADSTGAARTLLSRSRFAQLYDAVTRGERLASRAEGLAGGSADGRRRRPVSASAIRRALLSAAVAPSPFAAPGLGSGLALRVDATASARSAGVDATGARASGWAALPSGRLLVELRPLHSASPGTSAAGLSDVGQIEAESVTLALSRAGRALGHVYAAEAAGAAGASAGAAAAAAALDAKVSSLLRWVDSQHSSAGHGNATSTPAGAVSSGGSWAGAFAVARPPSGLAAAVLLSRQRSPFEPQLVPDTHTSRTAGLVVVYKRAAELALAAADAEPPAGGAAGAVTATPARPSSKAAQGEEAPAVTPGSLSLIASSSSAAASSAAAVPRRPAIFATEDDRFRAWAAEALLPPGAALQRRATAGHDASALSHAVADLCALKAAAVSTLPTSHPSPWTASLAAAWVQAAAAAAGAGASELQPVPQLPLPPTLSAMTVSPAETGGSFTLPSFMCGVPTWGDVAAGPGAGEASGETSNGTGLAGLAGSSPSLWRSVADMQGTATAKSLLGGPHVWDPSAGRRTDTASPLLAQTFAWQAVQGAGAFAPYVVLSAPGTASSAGAAGVRSTLAAAAGVWAAATATSAGGSSSSAALAAASAPLSVAALAAANGSSYSGGFHDPVYSLGPPLRIPSLQAPADGAAAAFEARAPWHYSYALATRHGGVAVAPYLADGPHAGLDTMVGGVGAPGSELVAFTGGKKAAGGDAFPAMPQGAVTTAVAPLPGFQHNGAVITAPWTSATLTTGAAGLGFGLPPAVVAVVSGHEGSGSEGGAQDGVVAGGAGAASGAVTSSASIGGGAGAGAGVGASTDAGGRGEGAPAGDSSGGAGSSAPSVAFQPPPSVIVRDSAAVLSSVMTTGSAAVASALSLVQSSRVGTTRLWRAWDWGAIALLLEHHLSHPPVFAAVLKDTPFLQRLGDAFCAVPGPSEANGGCGSVLEAPWTPASLRFVRAARQWLWLCLYHPVGRRVLVRNPVSTASSSSWFGGWGKDKGGEGGQADLWLGFDAGFGAASSGASGSGIPGEASDDAGAAARGPASGSGDASDAPRTFTSPSMPAMLWVALFCAAAPAYRALLAGGPAAWDAAIAAGAAVASRQVAAAGGPGSIQDGVTPVPPGAAAAAAPSTVSRLFRAALGSVFGSPSSRTTGAAPGNSTDADGRPRASSVDASGSGSGGSGAAAGARRGSLDRGSATRPRGASDTTAVAAALAAAGSAAAPSGLPPLGLHAAAGGPEGDGKADGRAERDALRRARIAADFKRLFGKCAPETGPRLAALFVGTAGSSPFAGASAGGTAATPATLAAGASLAAATGTVPATPAAHTPTPTTVPVTPNTASTAAAAPFIAVDALRCLAPEVTGAALQLLATQLGPHLLHPLAGCSSPLTTSEGEASYSRRLFAALGLRRTLLAALRPPLREAPATVLLTLLQLGRQPSTQALARQLLLHLPYHQEPQPSTEGSGGGSALAASPAWVILATWATHGAANPLKLEAGPVHLAARDSSIAPSTAGVPGPSAATAPPTPHMRSAREGVPSAGGLRGLLLRAEAADQARPPALSTTSTASTALITPGLSSPSPRPSGGARLAGAGGGSSASPLPPSPMLSPGLHPALGVSSGTDGGPLSLLSTSGLHVSDDEGEGGSGEPRSGFPDVAVAAAPATASTGTGLPRRNSAFQFDALPTLREGAGDDGAGSDGGEDAATSDGAAVSGGIGGASSGTAALLAADDAFAVPPALSVYTTAFTRLLLRRGCPGFADRCIPLLLRLLRNAEPGAAAAALSVLTEACLRSRTFVLATLTHALALSPVDAGSEAAPLAPGSAEPSAALLPNAACPLPLGRFPILQVLPLCLCLAQEPAGVAALQRWGLLTPLLDLWSSCVLAPEEAPLPQLALGHALDAAQEAAFATSGTLADEAFWFAAPLASSASADAAGPGGAGGDIGGASLPGGSSVPSRSLPAASFSGSGMERKGSTAGATGATTTPAPAGPAAPALSPLDRAVALGLPRLSAVFPGASAEGGSSPKGGLPAPWPLPLALPAGVLDAGLQQPVPPPSLGGVQPSFAAAAAADPVFTVDLDGLHALPLRLEVELRWEGRGTLVTPAGGGEEGVGRETRRSDTSHEEEGLAFDAAAAGAEAKRRKHVQTVAYDTFVDSSCLIERACLPPGCKEALESGRGSRGGDGRGEGGKGVSSGRARSVSFVTSVGRPSSASFASSSPSMGGYAAASPALSAGGAAATTTSASITSGAGGPPPCDGFVVGQPADGSDGLLLPPYADCSLRLSLHCGALPVSALGDCAFAVPDVTSPAKSDGTMVTLPVYAPPEVALHTWAQVAGWLESPKASTAPAASQGVPPSPRSGASTPGAAAPGGNRQAWDDHANLDAAAARLRRRNAAVVEGLSSFNGGGPSATVGAVRLAQGWVLEAGLAAPPVDAPRESLAATRWEAPPAPDAADAEPHESHPLRTARALASSGSALSGRPQVAALERTVSRVDVAPIGGAPYAGAAGKALAAATAGCGAGYSVSACPTRKSDWSPSAVAASELPPGIPGLTASSSSVTSSPAPSRFLVVKCPPGSPARFWFLVTPSAPLPAATSAKLLPPAVRLLRVEVGFTLLPKRPALAPLGAACGRDLLSVLPASSRGVAALTASGLLPRLFEAAFGSETLEERADGAWLAVLRPPAPATPEECAVTYATRRNALVALGQVASTPEGYAAVCRHVSPDFAVFLDAAARGIALTRLRRTQTAADASLLHAAVTYVATPPVGEGLDAPGVSLRQAATWALALVAQHPEGLAAVSGAGWVPGGPLQGAAPATVATATGTGLPCGYVRGRTTTHASLCLAPVYGAGAAGPRSSSGSSDDAAPAPSDGSAPPVTVLDDTEDPVALAFLAATRLPPIRPEWAPILRAVGDLGNRVTQREARNALLKARSSRPDLFASSALYMHVHAALSRQALALPVRRFLHTLFERVSFSDGAWVFEGPAGGGAAAGSSGGDPGL